MRLRAKAFVFAGFAAVLVGVAAAAAPAPPRWLPPQNLSAAGADAVIPDVTVDLKGDATVVWAQAKASEWTVQAVDRQSGRTWSPAIPLSSPATNVAAPQLATAGLYVAAVWVRFDGRNQIVQSSDRDPKTFTWSAPASLSTSGRDAQQPRIAIDAAGDAVAVWASVGLSGWSVLSTYRPHGGAWLPAVPLDGPTVGTAAPDIVIDSTGRAVAVWGETGGSGWRVYSSSRATDGTWSKAVAISGPDAAGTITPQLALEGTDDVTAVWSRSLGTSTVIESSTRSAANGAWSPAGQLFPPGPDALAPVIAVNKRGDGVLVWTSSDPKTGLSVVASLRPPAKAWGTPVVLATTKTGALAPQAALDARGNAVVVWQQSNGRFSRVEGASHRAGGSPVWSAPAALSKVGADAVTPQVALDADGDGAVAWARFAGQTFVVQGAGYDGTGPALNKLSIPISGVVGKRLIFAVTPTDVWTTVRTIRWSFGDGTVGSGRLAGHAYKRPGRYRTTVTATDAVGHVSSVRRWITIVAG